MSTQQSKVQFARGVVRLLRARLGEPRFQALVYFLDAFRRILPHTQISAWARDLNPGASGAYWASRKRRALTIRVVLPRFPIALTAKLERRTVLPRQATSRTLDPREQDICKCIIEVLGEFWSATQEGPTEHVVEAFSRAFDQTVVSKHINNLHSFSPAGLFASLRKLSERSYEARSIPLGVLVDLKLQPAMQRMSLEDSLADKKYQVLTDGYDTTYIVDAGGTISGILDLERSSLVDTRGSHRFYPEWSRQMALSCTGSRIGFSLTRQGDILYFDSGTLRITYRAGRWQYWNHSHVVDILLHTTRAQHVLPRSRRRILYQIYRRALDLSFRRTGGLYVLLRNRRSLHKIVRKGDAIGDPTRRELDVVLDKSLKNKSILGIAPHVLVDLASVDGAVVLANSGLLLAYGAVLDPKRKGARIRHGQGSRTKAAIAASHYGLATKVSSDGDIAFYSKGKELLSI